MSEKIIVKTDNRKNFVCTWPIVGKVTIDENGEFEANSIEDANKLIALHPEFYLASEGKSQEEKGPASLLIPEIKKNEEIQNLTDELTEEEKAEQKAALDALNQQPVDQLQKTELNELEAAATDDIAPQTTADLSEEDKKTENEINTTEETSLTPEEKIAYIASLPGLTRKELESICTVFPGGEWRGKTKELLVEYITEKLG